MMVVGAESSEEVFHHLGRGLVRRRASSRTPTVSVTPHAGDGFSRGIGARAKDNSLRAEILATPPYQMLQRDTPPQTLPDRLNCKSTEEKVSPGKKLYFDLSSANLRSCD